MDSLSPSKKKDTPIYSSIVYTIRSSIKYRTYKEEKGKLLKNVEIP